MLEQVTTFEKNEIFFMFPLDVKDDVYMHCKAGVTFDIV